ncbi:MAG: DNA repair protein RecO [Cyanobacteria bacterium REEB67]|nr:DNA repair protein RecO [Cyanobacteria bacterium REEB67]
MATFSLTAINVGTYPLGEADRIITFFSRERGLHRAVAKGARKPGTRLSGKSEPLNINRMLLARGRSLDIITQCESIETFGALRRNLERLAFALYYAELTQVFGPGLSEDAARYFDRLSLSVGLMAESAREPALLCLEFEFALLEMLGIRPQLDRCVACREPLNEQTISSFNHEMGGLLCQPCHRLMRRRAVNHDSARPLRVQEDESGEYARDLELAVGNIGHRDDIDGQRATVLITPLVWKRLVLARASSETLNEGLTSTILAEQEIATVQNKSIHAARRLMQGYIEYKAGKRMRALDLLANI